MFETQVRAPTRADFDLFRRHAREVHERAALRSVDEIARRGKRAVRERMSSAGLGRLGKAIDARSDADRNAVHRREGDGFSASAQFFIRSRSDRTRGTIESYTQGADIRPVRGRWLWIATDDIPRVTKKERMTPELYRKNGFEKKIGPLVFAKAKNGTPLLIAKDVSVSASGRPRSAKALTKTGKLRKGQVAAPIVVAFFAIPATSRRARVNITQILSEVRGELPAIYARNFEREAG